MTSQGVPRTSVGRIGFAALLAVGLLLPSVGRGAESSPPTSFRDCYKSIRSCQKSRCGSQDGQEQVSCMQQCNREYESCTGAARSGGGGGSVLGFPQKDATPTKKEQRQQRRNLERKTPGDQN